MMPPTMVPVGDTMITGVTVANHDTLAISRGVDHALAIGGSIVNNPAISRSIDHPTGSRVVDHPSTRSGIVDRLAVSDGRIAIGRVAITVAV